MPPANNLEASQAAVLAVVVLYGVAAEESSAVRALLTPTHPIDVLLWDNSPQPHAMASLPCHFTYHSDPRNPGSAQAYNAGLLLAQQRGIPWLLLLDQDTEITGNFLDRIAEALPDAPAQVAGFVPQLRHRNTTVSPFTPSLTGPNTPLRPGRPLQAFNSGAVLRAGSLLALGGFDTRFPLDYLDHATFAALQRNGGRIQVLQTSLEHPLSTDTGHALSPLQRSRQYHILAAERRFYRLYGTAFERLLHPVRLLRRAASVLLHKRDWASARQILQALDNGPDHA